MIEAARARRLERIAWRMDPLGEAELDAVAAALRVLERLEHDGLPP